MKFSEMPYERVDFNKVEEEFKQLMKEFGKLLQGRTVCRTSKILPAQG